MGYKDPIKQREYQKLWKRRKDAGLITSIINKPILTNEERILRRKNNQGKYLNSRKTMINEILGDKCFICKYDKTLICHRKDGKKHILFSRISKVNLLKELNSNEYIRLCNRCHKFVHWSMVYFKFNWLKIKELVLMG